MTIFSYMSGRKDATRKAEQLCHEKLMAEERISEGLSRELYEPGSTRGPEHDFLKNLRDRDRRRSCPHRRFAASRSLSSQAAVTTTTVTLQNGATGPTGPAGPTGPPASAACPAGYQEGDLVIVHPGGGPVTIRTCILK